MRQIVLDTETTGLEPAEGHRIIEIGCVELVNRRLTERRFHCYLQPDREIDEGAAAVHGITNEFLQDKPRFAEVAEELLGFLEGAELLVHNAPFDLGFLDHELHQWRAGTARLSDLCRVTDTLCLARGLHPGQRNSLDALCKRYGVENARREHHGALLDAEILAEVYLAMTGGQVSLPLGGPPEDAQPHQDGPKTSQVSGQRPPLNVVRAGADELAAHRERLEAIEAASSGGCLWLRLEEAGPASPSEAT